MGRARDVLNFFESDQLFSLFEGYWEDWAHKNTKSIKIVPLNEIDLKITPEFLEQQVSPNWCFFNAEHIVETFPGTKYVLGFATFSCPGFEESHVDHAWNSYKKKHFDVTRAVWNRTGIEEKVGNQEITGQYKSVIELNAVQLKRLKNKVGMVGSTLSDYYKYYVEPKER